MRLHPKPASAWGATAERALRRCALSFSMLMWCLVGTCQTAQVAADSPTKASLSSHDAAVGKGASEPPSSQARSWARVPRVTTRLSARDIGLVINTNDPYSVEVGESYIKARRLAPSQVLRLAVPTKAVLAPDEFIQLEARVKAFFGPSIQALALAWSTPYAVNCNSITGALTLGYDASLCANTCGQAKRSPLFNSPYARPFTSLKLRPSMLLAAPDVASAQALIWRGVQSDRTLSLRGAPPVHAHFVSTADSARNVRARLFPPAGLVSRINLEVHLDTNEVPTPAERVVLYETGLPRVDGLSAIRWVPGALADHLTSYGGMLTKSHDGQMPALAWIASGATASYGTVSEPCSYVEKFPHPQVLLLNYVQGSSAIEAYWKSVAWPQQGVFVGEPLAAPFARR